MIFPIVLIVFFQECGLICSEIVEENLEKNGGLKPLINAKSFYHDIIY